MIPALKPVPSRKADTHRGWEITWDYGQFQATGPDYDASYEGEEDGWVDNGHRVFARTRGELIAEIDNWFDENEPDARDIIAKHAGLGSSPYYLADRIIAELSKAGFAVVKGELA